MCRSARTVPDSRTGGEVAAPMVAVAPPSELLPVPARGPALRAPRRRVRLGDVDPRGRMRLDAIARHLQDVASDDAADSGLDGGWVVRRTLIAMARPAVARRGPPPDDVLHRAPAVRGPSGARRSSATDGASVEAVSLWVHVDPATGRPAALGERSTPATARPPASAGCRPGSPCPDRRPTPTIRPWAVRAVDLDVFDHVNNASHWPILEEVLAGPAFDRVGVAEIEYLVPVDRRHAGRAARATVDAGEVGAWLVADGRVHTAPAGARPASPTPRYGERMPLEGEYEPSTLRLGPRAGRALRVLRRDEGHDAARHAGHRR